jgi:hypothetical protein
MGPMRTTVENNPNNWIISAKDALKRFSPRSHLHLYLTLLLLPHFLLPYSFGIVTHSKILITFEFTHIFIFLVAIILVIQALNVAAISIRIKVWWTRCHHSAKVSSREVIVYSL